jgi:aminobenzoyl-glutamate transport protein
LKQDKRIVDKFLDFIEKGGNALPHPSTIFAILALVVIVVSGIGSALGWSVEFEGLDKKTLEMSRQLVEVKSLMNAEGIRYIFNNMVTNFTGFAPLGTVLVALLGIGIADKSGLMTVLLKKMALATPRKLVTVTIVFLGIMSNIASDAGYVVLPPLAALIFLSFKRHPLAGLTAAFAGVSGGFSANLLIGTIDPLLGGLSTEAAKLIDPSYVVSPTANYIFMAVSVVLISAIGWYVTEKIVEPRLGEYHGEDEFTVDVITCQEKSALRKTGLATLAMIAAFVPLYMVLGKDFLGHSLVPIMFIFFAIPGIAYGICMNTIKSDKDVMTMMGSAMSSMGGYMVLTFFAAQFIAFFNYSNLGTILAVKGAMFLEATGFTGIPLILVFILIVGFLNLFMGSASAKWAILAPVFIPMFMKVGYSPEFTQLAYRIGDSSTNIISPLMSYFAMIIVFMQKYDKKASLGTLVSMMLPFSMLFLIGWSLLLIVWMLLGLPIGFGAGIML